VTIDDPEVIDVRAEERLNVARLEPYLRDRLPHADGPFMMRQFGGGHANLTYLVRLGEDEYVVRRPPLGPVPAHAHDMRREHAVLSVLYRVFPLAPRSHLLCTDHAIVGSDFIVEERKRGIAIRRDVPEAYRGDRDFCARLGNAVVQTLAGLHRVDYRTAGLVDLGKPEGFVARQVEGWAKRWDAARTGESADAERIVTWLREHLPASPVASIVHNDFKLDNMLLDAGDPSRVTALLDWDMCTIGDPLMDLGYLLALWPEATETNRASSAWMPTWRDGFPTRAEAVQLYNAATGFDVTYVAWYHTFNVFRFAAILQQIYKRYLEGQTTDKRFRDFGVQANSLIRTAEELAAKT
jgi:aminoglycoside phosphotransferase (APT) family kinase protein